MMTDLDAGAAREQDPVLDSGTRAWEETEAGLRTLLARLPEAGTGEEQETITRRRADARRIADALAALTARIPSTGCRISEHLLPEAVVPGARRPVLRVYEPWEATGPLPAQLFLHGGGFLHGGSRESINDAVLAARTLRTGIRHLALDYALAPEHPFPVARDQVIVALDVLRERAGQFGIDPSRLGLGGNSAGASIAASAAVEIGRRGAELPHHLLLEVPALSLQALGAAPEDQLAEDQLAEAQQLIALYAPGAGGEAFVADALTLPTLPPVVLATAEHDPLRPGAELFARRLREAGGEVHEICTPGTVHGSPGITRVSAAARAWQEAVAQALVALGDSTPYPDEDGR